MTIIGFAEQLLGVAGPWCVPHEGMRGANAAATAPPTSRDGSATKRGLPPNTFKYYCIVTVYSIAINTNAGGLCFWQRDYLYFYCIIREHVALEGL
eukprot:COSAG01_NODE_855_length_13088_cov_13.421511_3_plen_96_part_00